MKFIVALIGVIAFIFGYHFVAHYFYLKREVRYAQEEIEWHKLHHPSRAGGTYVNGVWIDYRLQSFNSGRTWYAMEIDSGFDEVILGEVEAVYPGLMKTIKGWDKFMELTKDGPIKEITPKVDSVFKDVGITVNKK